MKQKKMLALTPSQLKQLYRHELPELTGIAARSGDAQTFKTYLSEYMAGHPQAESEAGKLIRLLIDYDGQKVHELSTDKQLPVS
ncbi:KamA family protein, partial [Bacteroides stercoris]